jgi:hypothetical protein
MMLDGTLCQECGVIMPDMSPSEEELAKAPRNKKGIPIIDRKSPGYPRSCPDCRPPRRRKGGRRG